MIPLPAIPARLAAGETQQSIATSLRMSQSTLNRLLNPPPRNAWIAGLVKHPPRAWTHVARRASPAFAQRTANILRGKYPKLEWCVVGTAVWCRRPLR